MTRLALLCLLIFLVNMKVHATCADHVSRFTNVLVAKTATENAFLLHRRHVSQYDVNVVRTSYAGNGDVAIHLEVHWLFRDRFGTDRYIYNRTAGGDAEVHLESNQVIRSPETIRFESGQPKRNASLAFPATDNGGVGEALTRR